MFSDAWLKQFLKLWNANRELVDLLKHEEFSALIGYGLSGDENPLFVLVVKLGRLQKIQRYRDQVLDWDLRASLDFWKSMAQNPPGILHLGLAYTQKKLICRKGNFSSLLKNQNLSKAFSVSFKIMNQVNIA